MKIEHIFGRQRFAKFIMEFPRADVLYIWDVPLQSIIIPASVEHLRVEGFGAASVTVIFATLCLRAEAYSSALDDMHLTIAD